jgi:glycosyltransferase involved in cell wall biosynthesis
LQAWFVEILLFRIAALVVFLSAFDRAWFGRWVGSGALVLCPIIREGKPAPEEYDGSYAPQFLFVGGADFPPNAFAIHWICSKLAPHLQMISSQVSILLVGKGVEKLAGTIASNVRPLGIVSDAELLRLLHSSAAIICTIVHGSGLKIKILEALSSGCPVFATAESLRGFEFMQVTPMLDLGDVSTTSSNIASFAADSELQRNVRKSIVEKWQKYVEVRRLALAKSIERICAGMGGSAGSCD